jgi:hypothetical protein
MVSTEIAASATRVIEELATPARFLGLQPLLTDVAEVPAAPGARAFAATERVPLFGVVRVPSRLHVELRTDPARGRVAFTTGAPLGIRLRGAFECHEQADATRVVESVEVTCPAWLCAFVVRQAIAAQEALLANLKSRLEAERE